MKGFGFTKEGIEEFIFREKGVDEAKVRISKALKDNETKLDLSDLHLYKVPNDINELKNLIELDIRNNSIEDISFIKNFKKLKSFKATKNKIFDISPLKELKKLEVLKLGENQIQDINVISFLNTVKVLNLENNQIQHFPEFQFSIPINRDHFLHSLDLSNNEISDIENFNQLIMLRTLKLNNNKIKSIKSLSHLTRLRVLEVNRNQISDLYVQKLSNLLRIDFSNNQISDLKPISGLVNLMRLNCENINVKEDDGLSFLLNLSLLNFNFSGNKINNFLTETISKLINLEGLSLNMCDISDVSFLSDLTNLKQLSLRNNDIEDIDSFEDLSQLECLNLSDNNIRDLEPIKGLAKLNELDLLSNFIQDVSPLKELINLGFLNLGFNDIKDLNSFRSLLFFSEQNNFKNQRPFLSLVCNPFTDKKFLALPSGYGDNNFNIIKSLLQREKDAKKQASDGIDTNVVLPAKVLFLGNHEAGKSTLCHFLLKGNVKRKKGTTHVLNIEPLVSKKNVLPEAMLFDFGGQDYYHGIHHLFFSRGALYLMLWKKESDKNIRISKDANNKGAHHFSLKYWIGQKEYFEQLQDYSRFPDPTLLIQTHVGKVKDKEFPAFNTSNRNIDACHVDFSEPENLFPQARTYLKETIRSLIKEQQQETEEPIWYIEFLRFIFSSHNEENLNPEGRELKELLPYYKPTDVSKEETLVLLKGDLHQLHLQGLVLYYPDINQERAWLNPKSLIDYLHKDVLKKEVLLIEGGRIGKNKFENTEKLTSNLLKVLKTQQVVFLHEYGINEKEEQTPEYIIPNYLPLTSENRGEQTLFTFDFQEPTFTVKFRKFIPATIINQLICFFGELPDVKRFWRDQLLFTYDELNAKILIKLDLERLEIKVSINTKSVNDQKEMLIKYLFYCINKMYWREIPVSYDKYESDNDENRKRRLESKAGTPQDMFISVEGSPFVRYQVLKELEENTTKVRGYSNEELERKELKDGIMTPAYTYRLFTDVKLKRMSKIFISYSKVDLPLVNEFLRHLSALKLDNKITTWYCTELMAAQEWDTEIEKQFEESDIVCFMVSANFMSTPYIHEHEWKRAFDRRKERPDSIKIVPIILDFCNWKTEEHNLGDFTALPYTTKPIMDFQNRNKAWYIVEQALSKVLASENGRLDDNKELENDVKKIYEEITGEKVV